MNQPTAKIYFPDRIKSHDRGGGAKTTPLVNARDGSQNFINGITEFAPGTEIPFHFHNCEESVMLLEGEAFFDMGGQTYELKAMDTTWIPAEVPHRFRNKSKTQPMKILWIYGSVDANRTLVETGETRPITAEHNK
jgi:quercetin dioxygenase-like cupin family protein